MEKNYDGFNSDNYLTVYLRSIYFMVTIFTTVGVGDFIGTNLREYVFIMAAIMFGQIIFSLMGNFKEMLKSSKSLNLSKVFIF